MNPSQSTLAHNVAVDAVAVISAEGDLDMLSAPTLAGRITTALSRNPRAIVIDLTDVEFLAAAGLAVLASAHAAGAPATQVVVVAAKRSIRRPIEITGIDKILPVFPTLSAAVSRLAALPDMDLLPPDGTVADAHSC